MFDTKTHVESVFPIIACVYRTGINCPVNCNGSIRIFPTRKIFNYTATLLNNL